ncbi:GNAT family N-acetyltransferase [Clostridium cadaveris]|uniref:GNAT family N-acetyltransferase n=1 Tax=Clostridium cadaveris TaxID=1529 RepID=A0A1I2NXY4_9CLOT|nr:GNAT family N-acetyltransferase [Clostridium cadaveris]MDM8312653.1 GNAT family N-acetyltransferase [Clostridium cadaveris]MDY4949388.1 GNAT family N-acetyltransferase [Clostridium cadaveris]NME64757.1 GNAT family N-acetyltransferase [Clostridium cadaveris]PWL54030.1 MAG: GNAT family N-acetyltransferase [Clostridium cadaveris]SFG08674.1 Protein N-acetyltransferase, RimJ/RimL family [Clostridium cadaveris]
MLIKNISQIEVINIDDTLRLRKFDYKYDFALQWYQDEELVRLVDGPYSEIYTLTKLKRMYEYLNNKGELYFIEIKEGEDFVPIGDVTIWEDDIPIVIGNKKYQGQGIGKKVIAALIERGRELGFQTMKVREIYSYNISSQKLFKSMGFIESGQTPLGRSYCLQID